MSTLNASDSGKTLHVAVGGSFTVRLSENGTAGYKWTAPEFDGAVLELQHDDTIAPPSDAAPGAGGAREFAFRVTAAGETKVETAYHRSWEPASAATTKFVATIVAKG